MMTDIEIKQGRALAGRIISGLREMTIEQRHAILIEVQAAYCMCCGADASACKCFSEVAPPWR